MTRTSTVLVVEDDPHISDLIVFLLQDAGYQTVTANTAAKAYRLVETIDLDLVILDWMLPDTPGDKLCYTLKSRPAKSFLPILMLTARSGLADRVAGLDAGADDFLTKPFHSDELMARVRALLRIRNAELERLRVIDELRAAYDQLATTQAQLVQTSRLAALGELVAGVAHELNNPLGIILGNAELLPALEHLDDQRAVQQIIEGAQRARRIVQSLVTFARQGKMEEDWYKPRDLVERVLDLKRADLQNQGIDLLIEYGPNLPMVWADGAQIQQVLLNLVLNAEYAVREREQAQIVIRVATTRAPIFPPPLISELDQIAESDSSFPEMVAIDLIDNGVGVQEEDQFRLFQPFFTTKPVGQGRGLGLAISYGIVTQHEGTMHVNSQPGIGCGFRVALPVKRSGVPPAPAVVLEAEQADMGMMLVVDGQPSILDTLNRVLNRTPWGAIISQRPEQAVQLIASRQFDLVLYNIDAAHTDSNEFLSALSSLTSRPLPPIVVTTSDASSLNYQGIVAEHDLLVLEKPFTAEQLQRALVAAATSVRGA